MDRPDQVLNSPQQGASWTAAPPKIVRDLVPERATLDPLHHDTGHDPWVLCHVREDDTIAPVPSLQEVFAEKASRTDADTEPGGDRKVVTCRLADPSVQSSDGKEHG